MNPASELALAIEVSNPSSGGEGGGRAGCGPSVALALVAGDGGITHLGSEAVRSASRHDDDLVPAMDRLVRRHGFRAADLRRVAVSIGPGGFTGLRVAVAAAKMICEATGARAYAVPTARALIRRVDPVARAGREVRILLAWKRDDAWMERYGVDGGMVPTGPGGLVRVDGLGLGGGEVVVCDEAFERVLRERGVMPESVVVVRPCFDAAAVLEASAEVEAVDPLALAPLYPREPEAVTKWRELHPGRG